MRQWDYKAKRAADVSTAANTTDPWLFKRADNGANVQVIVPNNTKAFKVVAYGTATGGTTTNFTPKIFFGDATTAVLAPGTARAVDSATGKFYLEGTFTLDLENGKLNGMVLGYNGVTNGTIETTAVVTASTCATQSALNGKILTVGGLFSAANAGNAAKLDGFMLEVLDQAK
jgi:hypothetical protein